MVDLPPCETLSSECRELLLQESLRRTTSASPEQTHTGEPASSSAGCPAACRGNTGQEDLEPDSLRGDSGWA